MVKIYSDDVVKDAPTLSFENSRDFVKRNKFGAFIDYYMWNEIHQYHHGRALSDAFNKKCQSMERSNIFLVPFLSDKDDKSEDKSEEKTDASAITMDKSEEKTGANVITMKKKDYEYLKCLSFANSLPYKLFGNQYNSLFDCKLECQMKEKLSISGSYEYQNCYKTCHHGLKKAIRDQVKIDEKNILNGNLDDIFKRLEENE